MFCTYLFKYYLLYIKSKSITVFCILMNKLFLKTYLFFIAFENVYLVVVNMNNGWCFVFLTLSNSFWNKEWWIFEGILVFSVLFLLFFSIIYMLHYMLVCEKKNSFVEDFGAKRTTVQTMLELWQSARSVLPGAHVLWLGAPALYIIDHLIFATAGQLSIFAKIRVLKTHKPKDLILFCIFWSVMVPDD